MRCHSCASIGRPPAVQGGVRAIAVAVPSQLAARRGLGVDVGCELPVGRLPTGCAGGHATGHLDLDGAPGGCPDDQPLGQTTPIFSVLYLEDHPSNVRLVERLLARRPASTLRVAATGREGLHLAAQLRPDLVLLDLNLPDLSGEMVLDRLWALPGMARTPVVVLTADATLETAARLRDRGVTDHLTKPLDVAAFYARLDDIETRVNRQRLKAC